ncbi:MAG: tetratricopeptide repeat protein [Candidatus Marinimicrobia bacterium]|nr:tetratricopeptide repeat protein [Candidatus Neomarinimicrobiota bacterium]MCF7923239.1 tetratricopeptide repeat protein [Candidatus Neomarinimicrobiota bacterium]
MISKRPFILTLSLTSLLGLMACTPKEPATPAPSIEQLKMQSQMKALSAEVVKLRESREEVELLKASIAAMDTQIVHYQTMLEEKAEQPVIELVATPRDPDIINLRGNIYVLIREIDSLKMGMKNLQLLNDSLVVQIEQLAFETHTEVNLEIAEVKAVAPETQPEPIEMTTDLAVKPIEEPVEKPVPAELPMARGYNFNTDYRMAYNDALNNYFNNDFLEAIQEFRILIQREPTGAYADNAQYWIGECYYSLEDFESAITEFEKVFDFDENNKSDHALFKIALSYQQLGRYLKARENMERFLREYPDSELASQAKDFLKGNRQN